MKDLYSQNSICYLNKENTIACCSSLATQAINLFEKCFIFKNFNDYEIMIDAIKNPKENSPLSESPKHKLMSNFTNEAMHDAIMIVAAFENYFKSILLYQGILIHTTNHAEFKNKQRKRPINFEEYKKNDQIIYNTTEQINRFSFLSENTLQISLLLKNEFYFHKYNIPEDIRQYLVKLMKFRNNIHFLAQGFGIVYSLKTLENNKKVLSYFNEKILDWDKKLRDEYDSYIDHKIQKIRVTIY